jgi:hypothetical protein
VKKVIPIIVRLHGPSLLLAPEQDKPVTERRKEELLFEHILRCLIVNLYQTAAEEFARRYAKCMRERSKPDDLERAAQLRLTLDGAPSAATIRDFWQAAGCVEDGVLFQEKPKGPEQEPPKEPAAQPQDQPKQDQGEPAEKEDEEEQYLIAGRGAREITLLASAAEAYRSCTGKVEASDETHSGLSRSEEFKAAAEMKGKDLRAGMASLFAGIAGGAGAALAGASPVLAAVCGAVTAFLGIFTLSFSSTFSREASAKQDIKFLPDTSVSGLVHRMPLLLLRFRQAGIAPIFVIDELDKVRNVGQRLDDLVARMKYLCADNAFFCFLTDRTYLAAVAAKNRSTANNRLLTVFTDLLFVFYDSHSLAEYLGNVTQATSGDASRTVNLKTDLECFRIALVHRARGLIFNLLNEIELFRKGESRFAIDYMAPQQDAEHQIYVVLQMAIEATLSNAALASRIRQNTDFAQVVYDILYYPTARWRLGEEELDCALEAVVKSMEEMQGDGEHGPFRDTERKSGLGSLSADDQEFVHRFLIDYVNLVCNRTLLLTKMPGAPDGVVDVVRKSPELLQPLEPKNKYRWLRKPDGTSFNVATLDDLAEIAQKTWSVIAALDAAIGEMPYRPSKEQIVGGLNERLAVIDLMEKSLQEIAL